MNIDEIEGLQYSDIIKLYDEIIESPDLISPHWCCYNGSTILIDWDYNPSWNPRAVVRAASGQSVVGTVYENVVNRYSGQAWTAGHDSDGWAYTQYLCNSTCSGSCQWKDPSC